MSVVAGVEELEQHADISELSGEWDRLVHEVGGSVFLRPGWISAWWHAFGVGQLQVFALRSAGRLRAVLPLIRRRDGFTSPTNWHTPEFGVVFDGVESGSRLVDHILAQSPHHLSLGFLAPHGDVALIADGARRAGYGTFVRSMELSPYVQIRGRDWPTFEASIGRHFRTELRRRKRRLSETGPVTFTVEDGRDDLERLLASGFAIEGSGWKTARGTAILSDPAVHGFYSEIARWAALTDRLRLAYLWVGDRPIGFIYAIRADNRYYHLKGGYDPSFRHYAPGMLVCHHLIERAFAEHVESYEFLGDTESFKLTWATGARERISFHAFSPSVRGALALISVRAVRPALKRAMQLVRR